MKMVLLVCMALLSGAAGQQLGNSIVVEDMSKCGYAFLLGIIKTANPVGNQGDSVYLEAWMGNVNGFAPQNDLTVSINGWYQPYAAPISYYIVYAPSSMYTVPIGTFTGYKVYYQPNGSYAAKIYLGGIRFRKTETGSCSWLTSV